MKIFDFKGFRKHWKDLDGDPEAQRRNFDSYYFLTRREGSLASAEIFQYNHKWARCIHEDLIQAVLSWYAFSKIGRFLNRR